VTQLPLTNGVSTLPPFADFHHNVLMSSQSHWSWPSASTEYFEYYPRFRVAAPWAGIKFPVGEQNKSRTNWFNVQPSSSLFITYSTASRVFLKTEVRAAATVGLGFARRTCGEGCM